MRCRQNLPWLLFRALSRRPLTVRRVHRTLKAVLAPAFVLLTVAGAVIALRPFGDAEQRTTASMEACRTNDCLVAVLDASLLDVGARRTLEAFARTEPNSGGTIDCHDAVHQLGEAAWKQSGVTNWVPGGSVCNWGFYHGFLVAASADLTLDEFVDLADRLCVTDPLPLVDLPGPECLHGFGHAVLHLTGSELAAVERCAAFSSLGERVRRRCNEGVAKDGLIQVEFVTDEVLARCESWPELDRGTCVYVTSAYAVVRAAGPELETVHRVCDLIDDASVFANVSLRGELEQECRDGLGRGVSMRAVGERFTDPSVWAEDVCGADDVCAFGFGKSVFFIRNDLQWSLEQCEVFAGTQYERCREGVRQVEQTGN